MTAQSAGLEQRAREKLPGYVENAIASCEPHNAQTIRDYIAALPHMQPGADAGEWPAGVLARDRTLEILRQHNEWRRGAETEQTDPRLLGLALDAAIAAIAAQREAGEG